MYEIAKVRGSGEDYRSARPYLCVVHVESRRLRLPARLHRRRAPHAAEIDRGHRQSQYAPMSIAFHELREKTGEVVNAKYLDDLGKGEWRLYSQDEQHKALMFTRDEAGKRAPLSSCPGTSRHEGRERK